MIWHKLFASLWRFMERPPRTLRQALREHQAGATLLLDPQDTSWQGVSYQPQYDEVDDAEVINAIRSVPCHYTGLSSLQLTLSTTFRWTAQNDVSSSGLYNPTTNSGTITKTYSGGTAAANDASGGGDEVFSFQQSVTNASSATLDLTAMTNLLQQASVSIARIKGIQFRLLSQVDDPTVAANASAVVVTNNGPTLPANIFGNGGSGLTLTLTTSTGVITGVAIGAAGSGYPRSSFFLVSPQQTSGAGGVIAVTTNGSGVPTAVALVAGAGGTGYSDATVPSVVLGHQKLNGGSDSLAGSAYMYFDATAAGFMLVSSTAKNIKFINMDATNIASVEVDIFAASS